MSTHGKIRFACRVVRLRDAMTGTRVADHVAHCADCQAYYGTANTVISQLRQTAPSQVQPTPDDLAQRIARAVRQTAPQPARRRAPALSWSTLAGVGAIAVVALSLAIVHHKSSQLILSQNQQNAPTIRSSDVAELVANVNSLRSRLLNSVEPTTETLAAQNPLTLELASVRADARSALGFIALNFLPADSVRQLESQIDPTSS
jgi:predicted anti-sigma-YlaC factor YlaD